MNLTRPKHAAKLPFSQKTSLIIFELRSKKQSSLNTLLTMPGFGRPWGKMPPYLCYRTHDSLGWIASLVSFCGCSSSSGGGQRSCKYLSYSSRCFRTSQRLFCLLTAMPYTKASPRHLYLYVPVFPSKCANSCSGWVRGKSCGSTGICMESYVKGLFSSFEYRRLYKFTHAVRVEQYYFFESWCCCGGGSFHSATGGSWHTVRYVLNLCWSFVMLQKT